MRTLNTGVVKLIAHSVVSATINSGRGFTNLHVYTHNVCVYVCVRKSSFGNNLPRLFSIHLCKNDFTTAAAFGPISLIRATHRGGLRCECLLLSQLSRRTVMKITLLRVLPLVLRYNAAAVSTQRGIVKHVLRYRVVYVSIETYRFVQIKNIYWLDIIFGSRFHNFRCHS